MALYTQFQDPAQYYINRDERRDENMRNLMGMMMQLKMQEREWGRQNFQDQLAERRVSAYEQSVADQNSESTKQWQLKEAALRRMYGYGSPEYNQAMAGVPVNQIEGGRWGEETVKDIMDWANITRDEWDSMTPDVKRGYVQAKWQRDNYNTAQALKQQDIERAQGEEQAKFALSFLQEQQRKREKQFQGEMMLGRDLNKAQNERINQAISELEKIVQWSIEHPLLDQHRKRLRQFTDIDMIKNDPYWFLPDELKDAARKKYDITGKNNLAKPAGAVMSVTPKKPGLADEMIAYGGGTKGFAMPPVITMDKAFELAKRDGVAPEDVQAEPIAGGFLVAINGRNYIVQSK